MFQCSYSLLKLFTFSDYLVPPIIEIVGAEYMDCQEVRLRCKVDL